jgi:hypothetical protein
MAEKKKKSTVSVVMLSILCFVLTLLLSAGVLSCTTLRLMALNNSVPEAVQIIPLEELPVQCADGTQVTLAQYILDNYVEDDRVSVEQVEELLQDGTFSLFTGELTQQYNDYLLGNGDFPEITAEDIVQLITENEDLIFEKTSLEFLEPDKQKLRKNLEEPLTDCNQTLRSMMQKGVRGFAVRSIFSVWLIITLGVLLLAILIWMLVFYVRGRKRVGTALKLYSIAAFVPCLLLLLTAALSVWVMGLTNLDFLRDFAGMLKSEALMTSAIGILFCVLLFCTGMLCNRLHRPVPEEETLPVYDPMDAPPEEAVEAEEAGKPEEVEETETAQALPRRRFCRHCGKPLVNEDAQFCYQCGTPQAEEDAPKS